MKKIIARILCDLFGHKYALDKRYSNTIDRAKCTRCNRKFGIHHGLKCIVDWDEDLENEQNK